MLPTALLTPGPALTAGWAGVDEVGRGPLAGPVVAAAVCLNPAAVPTGLADSKKLSAKQRQRAWAALSAATVDQVLARLQAGQPGYGWQATAGHILAVGAASVAEIDQWNILQASQLAMARAVAALPAACVGVWVDGPYVVPPLAWLRAQATAPTHQVPCIGGDATHPAISAASIIAKVVRDAWMTVLDAQYPGYGWARNAGYGAPSHLLALQQLGATPHHRRSFAPVAAVLGKVAA